MVYNLNTDNKRLHGPVIVKFGNQLQMLIHLTGIKLPMY